MMNHVKHQNMPASLLHQQDSRASNDLLASPKLLYCEKCGFATTLTEDFENHMWEHLTHFHCNHVAYSKKELEVHLLQHKYPFRCQYCGQGYMRREHLQNHIERLHGKDVGPNFDDAQTTLPEAISLSTAFAPRVQRTNVPTVKVRIPVPVTRNDQVNKSKRCHKMADLNVLNTPKVSPELISPVKNLVQHNMALTVPLPEEVSIPAGCMVELIEVKTVNGTKELKLRLVSQQESKSVLDDTVVASVNPLSSTLKHQNLSGNAEKSSVNRKKCMVKNINVKRPATFQTIVDKTALNAVHGVMSGTKRTLQESMVRNVEIPCALPTKIPRITDHPSRPGMTGPKIQMDALKPKTDHPPPAVTDKTANQLSKGVVSSCKTERDNNTFVERPRIPSELPVAVKEEPSDIGNKTATPEIKEEPLKQNDQTVLNKTSPPISLSVSTSTHTSRSTQMFSECKMQKVELDSTILMTMLKRPGSVPIDHLSTEQTKMEDSLQKSSIWSEPFESFPIISSVFSLSQQQGEIQSSIRPLVKALRGIVMRKDSPSVQVSTDHTETTGAVTEHNEEVLTTINCTQEGKDNAATGQRLLSQDSCDSVKSQPLEKCSQQTQTQAQKYYIKEESSSITGTDSNQKGLTSSTQHEPLTVPQEAGINNILNGSPGAGDGHGHMTQSACKKEDSSSKFLTVSLERIHMGLWKPSHKSPILSKTKPRPPIRRLCQQAFLYPAPLKVGQPVIRPGPNQPVVVLNHPKPAVPKRTDVDHLAEPQVSAEVLPKCQILKMRLSKVMGEKYEVIGCTVGFIS